jgi:DNA replication protein DnaC
VTVSNASDLMRGIVERQRQREEEHRHRMATDPAYRAEQERIEAESREREQEENRREERQRRASIEKGRREKGIPEKFWPYLDAWRAGAGASVPESVGKARDWVERFLAGKQEWVFLFLAGSVGTGKTSAACRFLDAPWTGLESDPWGGEPRKVTREAAGRFVTAEEIAKASTYAGEFWGELRDAPRLVLDDLGWERLDDKGNALANLLHLLAHRHAHRLRTVVTANLTRQAFEARYAVHDGGRLRDRLAESAWFVELTGPSQRRRLSLEEAGT